MTASVIDFKHKDLKSIDNLPNDLNVFCYWFEKLKRQSWHHPLWHPSFSQARLPLICATQRPFLPYHNKDFLHSYEWQEPVQNVRTPVNTIKRQALSASSLCWPEHCGVESHVQYLTSARPLLSPPSPKNKDHRTTPWHLDQGVTGDLHIIGCVEKVIGCNLPLLLDLWAPRTPRQTGRIAVFHSHLNIHFLKTSAFHPDKNTTLFTHKLIYCASYFLL